MSLSTNYFTRNSFNPELQDRVDAYRSYLSTLPKEKSHGKLDLLEDTEHRNKPDLAHAYTRFPHTEYPYVVRFVHQVLSDMHVGLPVAEMITERHIEAYVAIDIAFSGRTSEMVWDRSTREGLIFEQDVMKFLFAGNLHEMEKVAMLIDRRSVRSIEDIKEALPGMTGVHTSLIEGVL